MPRQYGSLLGAARFSACCWVRLASDHASTVGNVAWWQTLIVALTSAVVGGIIAAAGSYVVYLEQQRGHLRQQAVKAAAAALTALREIDPEVWVDRLSGEGSRELIADKSARWFAAVGRLELLAALHPDSVVEDLVESVIKKGGVVLIRLRERVGESGDMSDTWMKVVPDLHRAAVNDARQLARLAITK